MSTGLFDDLLASSWLFDDLLIDDAPASTGLFDDLLAPDERRRRRGGARNEFEPYVAGVETLPDHLAPIEASTAQAGRGGDAFARRDPRRVDRFVPDATFGSVAQDIGAGLLQIGPTAVKGAADLARLVTGDAIGKGLSDAMEGGMEAIRENVGSERAAAQRRNFEADMRDDSVSVWEALSENKGALADQILPTLGSMALPMGAAGAVGKLATMGRAAQALDKTALAARVASAQQAAGIGATAAQNAADTFAELVDRGVPMDDAYVAAGITVPFSVIAGRLTGGGAEMAAVRALSGGGVGRGLLALGQASGREGFQEIGEELGQITGEAVATGAMPSLASAGKQLAVAGALGGIVGGGVNVAGQAAETWRGAERAQDPLPRVEPALDTSIDQTVPPAPRRDPVETALDPSAPLDGKSLLDAFGITRVEPRAADPAPQSTPSTPDPLTEDFAGLAGDIAQAEAARGIAQPPAAPAMAHPQEEAPGALPTEPAPQYEILGSGTMLVKRPISEVRPLAPGAWMISAPGGTIVSRSAAPTVQAALDAEAQAFATSAAPAAAAAPDDATALAEGQPALTPAQAARALQAAPSPQPQPAVPQAQTTAASEAADYTANRDGTLIVNLAQQEAAALLPDVKLIQTGRGLLVGRTSAQEVAALLDVMHVPQSFASQQEASDFGRKHWPDGDIEVSDTGSGWVIMPRPKQESAHDLAAVAASVARLNAVIQQDQRGADRGGSVDVVPDADLVGVAGQQAAVLGRAIRAAFGVPVHFVRNLTANGAWYDGRVLLDIGHLSRNAQSPERTAGMLVAVTGHETEHAFQTSKDPRDVAINARLANVVRKHLKAGALQEQLAHEQSKSRRQITRKYAFQEIGANLGGGFWAQSSFWGDVYALDKGSTARRLFYRFMQAATKMATVLRGSRFDPSRYLDDVAAVRAAYVQATAERLGMRLPASLPATPPAAQPTSAAPGAAAQDRSTPGSEPDPRLQDPELRDEFEASRADLGWQQIGGRLLRDPRTAIDPNAADAVYNGDVVGRTQWLGSDLWRNRPHEGGRVTEQEAGNAIDRALRGAPLSARQRRFVSYVLDSIEARMTARERAARDALDEALIEAQDARIEAGIDAFWTSLAEVEAQEERDAIQAQDGADTEDAGRAGQAASAAAGVSQEGADGVQDAPRQGGVADEAGLTLQSQTPADLKARAQREQAAAAADKAEQRRLADKAKADAERDEFALTGSDRAADVGAAAGQQILFSQSDIDFTDPKSAADVLMAWGAQAQYQYDKTEAKGLAEIAEAKGATAEPETVTQPDNTEKPTGRWEITLPGVKPTADLVVEGDEVFINVARLPVGSGGSRVYDIAAQFALNNGKVFIGDPSGVSPAAMRRRLENMLSSAIKYGTTDHLAPHPRQTIGDSSMDLPPLKWQTGDTRGNILAMLRVSNAVNDRKQASGSGVDYDAGAGAFRDSEGVPLERVDEALSDLSEFDRGTAGPGAAGRTTLQRAALFRALLRSDSARRSLLARLRGVSGDGGKATGRAAPEIDRILYSQSDDSIDLATLYDGIIVEQPILIEDTGQTGTLRLDAGKAIADIDERSRKMRRLLACLG